MVQVIFFSLRFTLNLHHLTVGKVNTGFDGQEIWGEKFFFWRGFFVVNKRITGGERFATPLCDTLPRVAC